MAFEPLNGWNSQVLLASEATFGTTPNPAASQAFEIISVDMGPPEKAQTRDKQDRNIGRGMRAAFVAGRVEPIPFKIETSLKSRADADDASQALPIFKAAGLSQTLNSSTSAVYALSGTPVESTFAGLSVYRMLGSGVAAYEAEQGRGGVVKKLSLAGGDKEIILSAEGAFIGKYHLGYDDSITLANDSVTSIDFSTVEQGARMGIGWYQIESEVVKLTARAAGASTGTISRGALSTSAAAHSGQPMYPYFPSPTYTGSPIPETTCVVTVDSQVLRCLSWSFDFMTGLDHLPGETNSTYRNGVRATRYDASAKLRLVMHREDVALLGKTTDRTSAAASIVQGTGAGGICTINMPQMELEIGAIADAPNGEVIVDVTLKGKDGGTASDMWNLTLT